MLSPWRPRPGALTRRVCRLIAANRVPDMADSAIANQSDVEAGIGTMPFGMFGEGSGRGFKQARLLAGLHGIGGLAE